MKMCKACPFNCTEESAMASNLGCLPDPFQIVKDLDKGVWKCHDRDIACQGLLRYCRDNNITINRRDLLITCDNPLIGDSRKKENHEDLACF